MELVRQLAPALGFHSVDLLMLAGLGAPKDLAPLDAGAEHWVSRRIIEAVHLQAAVRREVLQFMRCRELRLAETTVVRKGASAQCRGGSPPQVPGGARS